MPFGTGIFGLSLPARCLSVKPEVSVELGHTLKCVFDLSERTDTDFPAGHGGKTKTIRISVSAVRRFVLKFWRKVQEMGRFH